MGYVLRAGACAWFLCFFLSGPVIAWTQETEKPAPKPADTEQDEAADKEKDPAPVPPPVEKDPAPQPPPEAKTADAEPAAKPPSDDKPAPPPADDSKPAPPPAKSPMLEVPPPPVEKSVISKPAVEEEPVPAPKPKKPVAKPAPPKPKKPVAKPAPPKPNNRKLAITDLAKVDEDFALQGEYFGEVPFRVSHTQYMGLQVMARGDGQFDAVLLRGGLPGAGWDRRTSVAMSGQRQGDGLTLTSDVITVQVSATEAVLIENNGAELARLPKMHRVSVMQDNAPPCGAIVLFDGTSADQFDGGKMNERGLLEVGGITKMEVQDFHLHLEFRLPYMPYAKGQGRGNSGVYIQKRYEVQILDSFGLEGVANECGGLYKQKAPDVNMCLPPLSWQTYDIHFTAARWDAEGNKIANARINVIHNGVPIHENYEIISKTGAGNDETSAPGPIRLQDHGNPVQFRNVWIVPLQPPSCGPMIIESYAQDCCLPCM